MSDQDYDAIRITVTRCRTFDDVLKAFGLLDTQGNRSFLKGALKSQGIDYSHVFC